MTWSIVSAALLLLLFSSSLLAVVRADTTIGIAFWGDVRSHLEPWPLADLRKAANCAQEAEGFSTPVGGIPAVVSAVDELESRGYLRDVDTKLRFVTGNLVSGETGYLSTPEIGWTGFAQLLQRMTNGTNFTTLYTPDIMALGTKEFEAGLGTTNTYLKDALSGNNRSTKVVVSNAYCSPSHPICTDWLKNYTLIEGPNGVDIGVVGFVNPSANSLADADPLKFTDPAEAISAVIRAQPSLPDVLIAVGTGTYEIAKSIIDKNPTVNLVIYGGGYRNMKEPEKYKTGYIATTGAKCGTRIGALKIVMDGSKKLREIVGKVDPMVTQNTIAVKHIRDLIDKVPTDSLGTAAVSIDGASCWTQECNLGNLVTDSMVHCAYGSTKVKPALPNDGRKEIISVWHGGAFYPDHVNFTAKITKLIVHTWLPYHNHAYLVKLTGEGLWYLLRQGATALHSDGKKWGQFLQVSNGIEVTYEDNRVSRIRVAVHDGNHPRFQDVEDNKSQEYLVVIPSIIHRQKSVFTEMKSYLRPILGNDDYIQIDFDDNCLENYIRSMGTITTGFEERIYFSGESGGTPKCNKKTGLTVFLTLFILALIVGSAYAAWRFFIVPRRANGNWCF